MKQTTLDLNGPILSFTTNPENVLVNNAGIATFVGIEQQYFQHKYLQILQQELEVLHINGMNLMLDH